VPSGDGNSKIGAQNFTKATGIASLWCYESGVIILVHGQRLFWTERDADITTFAPIVIEDDLVSLFFP